MKIVIAPDSFKGCMSAAEVGEALKKGILSAYPDDEVFIVPMADGGEGTMRALVDATAGEIFEEQVCDPLGRKITAEFGIMGDGTTAVIEMAQASGLTLLSADEKNPMVTTTYGTGELIKAALDRGVSTCIVGIGGSATNDGGAGMAQALGARLLDENGDDIQRGGGALKYLDHIDTSEIDSRLRKTKFIIACDVTNPLTGKNGASAVYGPQKGATQSMINELDKNLSHYANIIEKDLGKNIKDIPGSGAAGGLGAGLLAFTEAELKPGIDIVINAVDLPSRLEGADLVITGEGKLDDQTKHGKTPAGVALVAKSRGIPVVGIGGSIGRGTDTLLDMGFAAIVPICDHPMSLRQSIRDAERLLRTTGERIMRLIRLGESIKS